MQHFHGLPKIIRVPIKCETKRKSTKTKRNQQKRNEIKRNQRKQSEIDWYDLGFFLYEKGSKGKKVLLQDM